MKLHEILQPTQSILAPWMFQTREEIEDWIAKNKLYGDLVVNEDLTVDVRYDRSFVLYKDNLEGRPGKNTIPNVFPIQFNKARSFSCMNLKLVSLRGAPRKVLGDFYCSHNFLTSLEGGPAYVRGEYNCIENRLTSLEGVAESIGNSLTCYNNPNLTSLHNIHKYIKSLKPRLLIDSSVTSNILGVLKINNLRSVASGHSLDNFSPLKKALEIIFKYLPGGNIHECQEELIEAGLKEYARL